MSLPVSRHSVELVANLKADFKARLIPLGFVGTGLEYAAKKGHVLECLDVQDHSSGTKCCVNLGVHLDFIPSSDSGERVDFPGVKLSDCELSRRLTPSPGKSDSWWSYEDAGAREHLLSVIEERVPSFFQPFEDFPEYWQEVSINDFKTDAIRHLLPGLTHTRAALLLAQVHKYLGEWAECGLFAEYGLEVAPSIATGPKKKLRDLLALSCSQGASVVRA